MRFARTIILIDDDLDDHEVFRTACANLDSDIHVTGFENGEEALVRLTEGNTPTPDMIFLDLNMPRLNGMEVLEALKQNDFGKSVPIMIYTTSFDAKVEQRCLELGATEVIEKPNSFDALCQKLETLLKIPV
jgi:CheY-like chemotaxis protein